MTEIPEHLRKRAEEARRVAEGVREITKSDLEFFAPGPKIPAHLLERARARRERDEFGRDAWVAVAAERPSWDEYFLNIARQVSTRADCRRAQHGAVIAKHNRIVSTGYNGSPAGGPSCLAGECPRGLLTAEQMAHLTADYSNCIAIHAEANAIAYASRADTEGATIYVTGASCDMCSKLIAAAGIARVVIPTA